MISDDQLYALAIFLGSLSMLLIVLYHWLEVNAKENDGSKAAELSAERKADAGVVSGGAGGRKGRVSER